MSSAASAAAAPAQSRMLQGAAAPDCSQYLSWRPEDVANFFSARGYGEYAQLWIDHKLTGERLVLLAASDLEKMGINLVGDRLGIQKELRVLKSLARKDHCQKVVAQHNEAYDGPWIAQALHQACCWWLCPLELDRYILTTSSLKLKSYHVARCCGKKCYTFGGEWRTDTVNLERIVDVDTTLTVKGCGCCAERKCVIDLAARAGSEAGSEESRVTHKQMFMDGAAGEAFAQQIRDQIEERRLVLSDEADRA